MSSSIYILPGARTLSSLELADGRTGADSFHVEPNASEPSVPYDNNADPSVDLVGPLHLQLFAPQTMAYSQGTQELMHTVTDYTRVLPATPIPSWFRMYAQTGGGHLPGMENETNSGYHEQESKPHLTDALAHTQVFDQNAIQSEYTTFSAALGEHTETQPSHSNYSVTKTAVRPASACLPFDGTAKMEPGATVHAILFTDGENIPHPSTTASQKETFSKGKVSYDRTADPFPAETTTNNCPDGVEETPDTGHSLSRFGVGTVSDPTAHSDSAPYGVTCRNGNTTGKTNKDRATSVPDKPNRIRAPSTTRTSHKLGITTSAVRPQLHPSGIPEDGQPQSTDASLGSLSRSSYMCRKCRAHGKLLPVKQHKRNCPFRNCTCPVCSLVNYGRHIVAKQIALYRDQKNHAHLVVAHPNRTLGGTPDGFHAASMTHPQHHHHTFREMRHRRVEVDIVEDDGPHCRRCRNHGKSTPWKGHKKTCPYRYCICQQCILISLRKSNEKNLREVVQEVREERAEKRERTCVRGQTQQEPPFKGFTGHVGTRSTGPEKVPTNPYLQPFGGSMAFPPLSLTSPHTFFPYPYLSRLTEAYTTTRLPFNPALNVQFTQPGCGTTMSLPSVFSQPITMSTPMGKFGSDLTRVANMGTEHVSGGECGTSNDPIQTTPLTHSSSTDPESMNLLSSYQNRTAFDLAKGVTEVFLGSAANEDDGPGACLPVHCTSSSKKRIFSQSASDTSFGHSFDSKAHAGFGEVPYAYPEYQSNRHFDPPVYVDGISMCPQVLQTHGLTNPGGTYQGSAIQNECHDHSPSQTLKGSGFPADIDHEWWIKSPVYPVDPCAQAKIDAIPQVAHEVMFRSLVQTAAAVHHHHHQHHHQQQQQHQQQTHPFQVGLFGDPCDPSPMTFGSTVSTNKTSAQCSTSEDRGAYRGEERWIQSNSVPHSQAPRHYSHEASSCGGVAAHTVKHRAKSGEEASYVFDAAAYQTRAAALAAAAAAAVAFHHEVTQQQHKYLYPDTQYTNEIGSEVSTSGIKRSNDIGVNLFPIDALYNGCEHSDELINSSDKHGSSAYVSIASPLRGSCIETMKTQCSGTDCHLTEKFVQSQHPAGDGNASSINEQEPELNRQVEFADSTPNTMHDTNTGKVSSAEGFATSQFHSRSSRTAVKASLVPPWVKDVTDISVLNNPDWICNSSSRPAVVSIVCDEGNGFSPSEHRSSPIASSNETILPKSSSEKTYERCSPFSDLLTVVDRETLPSAEVAPDEDARECIQHNAQLPFPLSHTGATKSEHHADLDTVWHCRGYHNDPENQSANATVDPMNELIRAPWINTPP